MRILFDARGLRAQCDGLGNYIRHLLDSLLRLDGDNEYLVLAGPAGQAQLRELGVAERPNLRLVPASTPFMGLAQQVAMPRLARRLPPADLYHYPHFDLPWGVHDRTVVTIYDLNHICLPEYFDTSRALKRAYSLVATGATLRKARHIITISHASKDALLKRFPRLDPVKISVVYFGVNRAPRPEPQPEELAAFRRAHGLGEDRVILYVGTARPHKNLARLLRAYAQVRRDHPAYGLLLVGSSDGSGALRRLAEELGVAQQVRFAGYLPEGELRAAYAVSDALAFCSLSEGFGMPILEAMAWGVPVVTSRIGAMAEVADGGALLVDPWSVESIADGLRRLVSSQALRDRLAVQGLERAASFTWERTAAETLAVYRQVVGAAPKPVQPASTPASQGIPAHA